jgi:putative transposase
MGRNRYKIDELTHPHFVTCTVLHWLPLFTNQQSVQIILNSLSHLQKNDNLKLNAYVILENHLHLVAQGDDLRRTLQKFKSYTAYQLLELLKKKNVKVLLDQFAFYKKAHKDHTSYQIWEEGNHPQLIQSDAMMVNKINYIHENPVKRGYVDEPIHWRYSSARDYEGFNGLLEVERFW